MAVGDETTVYIKPYTLYRIHYTVFIIPDIMLYRGEVFLLLLLLCLVTAQTVLSLLNFLYLNAADENHPILILSRYCDDCTPLHYNAL